MIGFAGLSHLGIVYSTATAARGFHVMAFDPGPGVTRALAEGRLPFKSPVSRRSSMKIAPESVIRRMLNCSGNVNWFSLRSTSQRTRPATAI